MFMDLKSKFAGSFVLFLLASLVFPCLRASSVALVSESSFHQELIPGYIHILQTVHANLRVFLPTHILKGDRFRMLEYLSFTDVQYLPLHAQPPIDIDASIFISPEYAVDFVKKFLSQSNAKRVAFVIHNGDAKSVPALFQLRPDAEILTLAPHVQKFMSNRLNRTVQWIFPTWPLRVKRDCISWQCFQGFSIQVHRNYLRLRIAGHTVTQVSLHHINTPHKQNFNSLFLCSLQGNVQSSRRNYRDVMSQLQILLESNQSLYNDSRAYLRIVGSGQLQIPANLSSKVVLYNSLK